MINQALTEMTTGKIQGYIDLDCVQIRYYHRIIYYHLLDLDLKYF